MPLAVPAFRYHPNPLKTGNAIQKTYQCICCNEHRVVAYKGPVYSIHDIEDESLCLECIANGLAADKYDAIFVSDMVGGAEVKQANIDQLFKRTPGYISWQGDCWLTHCNDICVFHGDYEKEDLIIHFEDIKEQAKEYLNCSEEELKEVIKHYNSSQSVNPAFYKFGCLHCGKVLLHSDFT